MVKESRREIASHPLERKLWALRKIYAGNGGILPPTDPRILALTEQQIDIEFEHLLIDKEMRDKDSGNQVYVDESYEADEAEEERIDQKLFVEYEEDDFEAGIPLPKSEKSNDDEWVDVEIDDDN
jgi:hypothetical protein